MGFPQAKVYRDKQILYPQDMNEVVELAVQACRWGGLAPPVPGFFRPPFLGATDPCNEMAVQDESLRLRNIFLRAADGFVYHIEDQTVPLPPSADNLRLSFRPGEVASADTRRVELAWTADP